MTIAIGGEIGISTETENFCIESPVLLVDSEYRHRCAPDTMDDRASPVQSSSGTVRSMGLDLDPQKFDISRVSHRMSGSGLARKVRY